MHCESTKCWQCSNFHCSWRFDCTPVKDWEAEPRQIRVCEDKIVDTFLVLNCPEFRIYKKNAYNIKPDEFDKRLKIRVKTFLAKKQNGEINLTKNIANLFANLEKLTAKKEGE